MRSTIHNLAENCLSIICVALLVRATRADFPELIRRIPGEANALIMIDAERLFDSPLAQKEEWKKRQLANYADRPMSIPPQATKVVRAAQLDLQTKESIWELVMLETPKSPFLEDIAKREKGFVDTVANTKAVWSPRGAYIVKIGQNAVGLTFPPNRQFLSRWLKERSGKIAPYLLEASESMRTTGASFVLAIDLDDAVEQSRTDVWLKRLDLLKQAKTDSAGLAKTIAGLRGVKFEVVFNEKPWGQLQLDFAEDPAAVVPVAKPLVIAALKQFGAALDDLESWTVAQKDKSVTLHGQFSNSGLMRLSSLFDLPTVDLDNEEQVAANTPLATLNHFKSVDKLLKDLLIQKPDAVTIGQYAVWVQQYAKRIDRLSLTNVDPEMQAYSAGVANDLRQIATALKGGGINTSIRQAGTYQTYDTYDGYYGTRNVSAERRAIQAEETGQSALTGIQLSDRINSETVAIRQKMSARYKLEF